VANPALLVSLDNAITDTSIKSRGQLTVDKLNQIKQRTAELRRHFLEFENTFQTTQEPVMTLMVLVQQAYEIVSEANLSATLAMSKTLDPSLKHHLLEAVAKLGRYYTVSCDLVSAARGRNRQLFRRVSATTVDIFSPPGTLTQNTLSLKNAVQNIIGPQLAERRLETYFSARLATKEEAFQSRLSTAKTPWKVLAEIKLLFYYELHRTINRPRVLSSSKSACYLCNLFINIHGDFFTPRTHGRLYDRWILPDWPEGIEPDRCEKLTATINKFNTALEKRIRLTLDARRASFSYPNESVLIRRAHWSSSVLRTPTRSVSNCPSHSNVGNGDQSGLNAAATTSCILPEPQANSSVNPEEVVVPELRVPKRRPDTETLLDDSVVVDCLSVDRQHVYEHLPRGQWTWQKLRTATVVEVSTPRIHMTFSSYETVGPDEGVACGRELTIILGGPALPFLVDDPLQLANMNVEALEIDAVVTATRVPEGTPGNASKTRLVTPKVSLRQVSMTKGS
jgi:hypothetical protein